MKLLFKITLFLISINLSAQNKAFQDGEWFKFKVSYSGFLSAGYATLKVDNAILNGQEVYHVKGYGKNTGLSRIFFKVEDFYETYMDKKKDIPYRFVRDINEGGHTRDIVVDFDHKNNLALVHDRKKNTKNTFSFPDGVQDMLSTFYYLRNNVNTQNIKPGEYTDVNMFYGDESFKFRLKFLRREVIKTKFGKIQTLVFRPYVESGRVFKEKESLTVWISDDNNKIPLKIVADLAVGSIVAELDEYKGLKHWFKILAN
ncbi:DUF3108 domain-containing protein [Planktosalinus lacus]|uniref:DUF3108 domain-containing protein n=1 Tax=Planktosalinus lacus TaxID=1526573 RepID=A0A8J2YA26_9FLAO|nr:DUF3108 domain-containing protein [Planktosalinus lacus]GGD95712.1 hypothetical protein GCM10011312_19210 [Planktosalinus lacus]